MHAPLPITVRSSIEPIHCLRACAFTPVERAPAVAIPATKLCFLAHANGLAESGFPGDGGLMLNGHGGDALYLVQPPFVDAASSLRFGVSGARRAISRSITGCLCGPCLRRPGPRCPAIWERLRSNRRWGLSCRPERRDP
ncbi:hypothetical protein [Burkholderia ubonensis]|uniref:hypothetical protein n=1 Tax=Burkholderia ubonensis TaxID=101571 RepID=UPI0012FCB99C|nr:hypothetical protein [Burkholderia ubonensis]